MSRMYNPTNLAKVMKKHGIDTKKRFGQHFLTDGNIIRKIADAAEIGKGDRVLEIGPGLGVLTEELALRGAQIVAVEIDRDLISILEEEFIDFENVKFVKADASKVKIEDLYGASDTGGIKVAANLPYNMATLILENIFSSRVTVDTITVMVQKEMAERMVAAEGTKNYSPLSLFIKYYSDAGICFKVSPNVFIPPPKVHSAVVKMVCNQGERSVRFQIFQRVVHAAFSKRRKTLKNSMTGYAEELTSETVDCIIEKAGINPRVRAEDLNFEEYLRLSEIYAEVTESGKPQSR